MIECYEDRGDLYITWLFKFLGEPSSEYYPMLLIDLFIFLGLIGDPTDFWEIPLKDLLLIALRILAMTEFYFLRGLKLVDDLWI